MFQRSVPGSPVYEEQVIEDRFFRTITGLESLALYSSKVSKDNREKLFDVTQTLREKASTFSSPGGIPASQWESQVLHELENNRWTERRDLDNESVEKLIDLLGELAEVAG